MSSQSAPDLKESEIDFFERLNYFFGKLLTERDFVTEQDYFNEKRWMLNRQTIGWGVVCGLEVVEADRCPTQVTVKPGLALDCYGHEIFLGKEDTIDLVPKEKEKADSLKMRPIRPTPALTPQPDTKTYYICIKYKECLTEPVPAPVQKCGLPENECLFSRVRELYELKVLDKLPTKCDSEAENGCPGIIADPCHELTKPCKKRTRYDCITLAEVTLENGKITEIDNYSHRKWLWSNEDLAKCMEDTFFRARGARADRKQFVPLLTQTIKGLQYKDGRNLVISKKINPEWDVGVYPYHITSDGENIWFIDQKATKAFKLCRDTHSIKTIELDYPAWGIAFDCKYLWVTHPQKPLVSKIDAKTNQVEKVILKGNKNLREIVFDGEFVWITHDGNPNLTKIDVHSNQQSWVPPGPNKSLPLLLLFDGEYIWVASENELNKINRNNNQYELANSIKGKWTKPETMTFDGTHIWITHENGVSKIDVSVDQYIDTVSVGQNFGGSTFEGMYLWTAGSDIPRIYRLDIFHETFDEGQFQLSGAYNEPVTLSRMCFDGHFVWVTGHEEINKGEKTGIIYRLLI